MTEFARFLLAGGASLSYGGDLRQGGFTRVLFELLAAYRAISGEDSPPVQSWLAWPIHHDNRPLRLLPRRGGWSGRFEKL
jgi:hypothetical protein